jgi:hypothetical protein
MFKIAIKFTAVISQLMTKINLWFKNWQRYHYVIVLIICLFIFYWLLAMSLVSHAELDVEWLKQDVLSQPLCHEACLSARQAREEVIVNNMRAKTSTNLMNKLRNYLLDATQSVEFRQELVRLMSRAWGYDNPPQYLQDYFNDFRNPVGIRSEIMIDFSLASLRPNPSSTGYLADYFQFLRDSSDDNLRQLAIKVISNDQNKNQDFSLDQLVMIKDLVINPNLAIQLRTSLIFLLSDYYQYFPAPTQDVLQTIYNNLALDNISRYLAADFLERISSTTKLVRPEVGREAWQAYYHN